MKSANFNQNGKIWFFVNDEVNMEIMQDSEQKITIRLSIQGKNLCVTMVYAKCNATTRLRLWDDIYAISNNMTDPWIIGGDFNVIINEEEKIGGLPILPAEYDDFAFCVNSCKLYEVQYKESPITWWNGRTDEHCIYKKLDKMLTNSQFENM